MSNTDRRSAYEPTGIRVACGRSAVPGKNILNTPLRPCYIVLWPVMTGGTDGKVKLTIANILTLWRIVTAPVFMAVWFTMPDRRGLVICLALAILSEVSDGLDGYFARRSKTVSDFGKLIDPYADSIFRLTVFFCFASNVDGRRWIPLWMPVLLFYRDVVTSVIRTFAIQKGIVVAARWSGKIKAVSQGIAIIMTLILFLWFGDGMDHDLFGKLVPKVLVPIVVLIGVGSGIDYLIANRSVFSEAPAEEGGE